MQSHGGGNGRKQQFRERLGVLRDTALHERVKHALPAGRWTRRHWIQASLFTTIGVLMATIVPGFSNAIQAPVSTPHATFALDLPELSEARQADADADSWQIVRVKPGQTMGAIFEELGIPAATLYRLLENADAKQALTRLKPGAEIAFDLPATGGLRTLRYDRDPGHRVELTIGPDKITERVIARETTTRTVVLSGKVGRSLNRSARKAGLTAANINSLTDEIFKYDIDFNSDLGPEDRFSVVVEQTWREGELISTGPVQAATFTVNGKLRSGFRFTRPGGKPEYFTADGRPLKKSFIRMPIQYARMSSKFGARRHPVLGTMRMHKGVDYAASTGTPIMAAGDGRVQFAGWQGGYGRTVILDHGKGHTTLYGHMSRLGNIKPGQRVAQGTVIGYVGTTGLSTGPHLHYEFRINGVHRNPLSVTMPPPEPLSGAQLASFRTYTANALARIRTVEDIIYADVGPAEPENAKVTAAAKPAAAGRKGSGKG
ncbi:peptidoglycan DD-metalloendopeptidase family protein [Pseudoxanthomonas putridarboris]|uniref:Peptidoglycan DD-metalloendopeptidase family protein n=1 Tax=Pseudoxanthomonas putridarboris TaxID=752605 RepID=A0ABU9IXK2_9GAMM